MEKISHIVRGNSRVNSVDVKSSGAVRPGALTFGRDVGSSPGAATEGERGSTASRAASLQSQMADRRSSSHDRLVDDMADQFFMSRIRRPEDPEVQIAGGATAGAGPAVNKPGGKAQASAAAAAKSSDEEASEELNLSGVDVEEKVQQPQGYQPRGSYIDVRA